MSRAFVKEHDEPDLKLQREEGRPITPAGFAALRARAHAETDPERRAALERTLGDVAVVGPPADRSRVAFGAHVRVSGAAETDRVFTIVGEDEIDVEHGMIGEASPLAQALLGKRAKAKATWQRPAGKRTLVILDIAYDDLAANAA